MKRGRIFIYLALIMIIGVVVVFFVFQRFMSSPQPTDVAANVTPTPEIEMVDVVVVSQQVARGQVIDETVLTTVEFPRDSVADWMFSDVGKVVGRRARVDLEPEFVLTRNMVTDAPENLSSTGSNAALLIPRGMVAVSIPISRLSSVSFAPQRGDHVNVIATMLFVDLDPSFQSVLPNGTSAVIPPGNSIAIGPQEISSSTPSAEGEEATSRFESGTFASSETITTITAQGLPPSGSQGRGEVDPAFDQTFYIVPSEPQRPRLVSQTLLQDVIVLQMGNFPTEDEEDESAPSKDTTEPTDEAAATTNPGGETEAAPPEPPPPPDVITLIVSPQDAITLNYLMISGAELTLALRGAGDDTRVQTEAVTMQYLLDAYSIPLPAKLPYGFEPRIDSLTLPALLQENPTETQK